MWASGKGQKDGGGEGRLLEGKEEGGGGAGGSRDDDGVVEDGS